MFRVFVVGSTAYITEDSDSGFRKSHNLKTHEVELIASYATREALTSRQFERSLKQYNVASVIDETTPVPAKKKGPMNPYHPDFPADRREEIKQRVSQKLKGIVRSPETRAKIVEARKKNPQSPHKGKKHSIITKMEISEKAKGNKSGQGLTLYSDPYTGQQIRLQPGQLPPPGFIKGLTDEGVEKVTRGWVKHRREKKRKLTDE